MITLIIGRREQGKTTLARYLSANKSPRMLIDPRRMWDEPETAPALQGIALQAGEHVVVPVRDLQVSVDYAAIVATDYVESNRSRSLTVVMDESGLYDVRSWHYLMRTAPRANVHWYLTTHRPQDIDTTVRSIADHWIMFRCTQPHDLDAIEKRCGAAVREDVSQLEPRHFIIWDDALGQARAHRRPDAWAQPRQPSDPELSYEPRRRTLLD